MKERIYDPNNAKSIFRFSKDLLHRSLAEAVCAIDDSIKAEDIVCNGKGGLGQMVEKYYYGYEPNSDSGPDFREAGVELKTTPLKKLANEELAIKERLVCDMIDFCDVVKRPFEESFFYKKSLLMLILFYLHVAGKDLRDLEFLYSVLWKLKDKDLLIIKRDYETIIDKIKAGKAHELSEGDTMYLGACRKGKKGDPLRKQPFSDIGAPKRAFALKTSYMRTILEFVRTEKRDMVTNTDIVTENEVELVAEEELKKSSFEDVLTERFMQFKGQDYREIAGSFKMEVNVNDKSKYARIAKRILSEKLKEFDDAEEIKKSGIIAKTVRIETNGKIRESMSFENINYDEIADTEDWIDSRWYEIATSRFMFIVFRAVPDTSKEWENEKRYVLDRVFFWTMPAEELDRAEEYWNNIKENVTSDTLTDEDNTFWKMTDRKDFHVRPKAQTAADKCKSPVSGVDVPKKAYWFNNDYIQEIVKHAYADEWQKTFEIK